MMMKRSRFLLATAAVSLLLCSSAWADTVTGYADSGGYISGPSAPVGLFITPFDTSLGTLNSVTIYPQVVVDGSIDFETFQETTTLTYAFTNTLNIVEMGSITAAASDSYYFYNGNYSIDNENPADNSSFTQFVDNSDSNATPLTITGGFGRFILADPVEILMTLDGFASLANSDDILSAFTYGGKAGIECVYDFTPVPEPSTMFIVGTAIIGMGGYVRRRFS